MTTTPKTSHRRDKRRSTLFPLNRDQLLPLDLPGLPEPIVEINRRATEALEKLEEGKRKASELEGQAEAAPRFDQLAAQAAADAGEKPSKPTTDRKRDAAVEARQHADALEQVAKQRVRELYDAVEDNYPAYLESRRILAEHAVEPLRELVPKFLDHLVAFYSTNVIYQRAKDWHNNPASAALFQGPGNVRRQHERAIERQRSQRADTPIANELPDLLAALARKLEEEIEGVAETPAQVIRSGELAATKS